MTTCSRTGCTKTLRPNNTTGVCGSGCQSNEAPPSLRVGAKSFGRQKPVEGEAMHNFRVIAKALGHEPDAILEEFAQGWINALKLSMVRD